MKVSDSYVVVGTHSWSRAVFDNPLSLMPGTWFLIHQRNALTYDNLKALSPRYVFFLHWSWKVPVEILSEWECIGFHMTDLPYGRGGSPLQNLILRGHTDTKLTAFHMEKEMDSGAVYLQEDLSLRGSAGDIYLRAAFTSARMVEEILRENPAPRPQRIPPTSGDWIFIRRRPEDSEIGHRDEYGSLSRVYDTIRMVDAEDYPKAFIENNRLRYEFTDAQLGDGVLDARVRITKI